MIARMTRADPNQLSPALLTKAMLRAVDQLNLAAELPSLIHVPIDDIPRMRTGERVLDPQREEWQGALRIVSLFRTTVEVLGSVERAKTWLNTENETLGGAAHRSAAHAASRARASLSQFSEQTRAAHAALGSTRTLALNLRAS
jgi:hypothetical protein